MLDDDFLSNKCMDRVATIAMATKSCLVVLGAVAFIEVGADRMRRSIARSFSRFFGSRYSREKSCDCAYPFQTTQ